MKKILSLIVFLVCCDFVAAQTYTLQQLKDSALHNNIVLRNALHSIDAAQHQRKEAFTKYFPSVRGTGFWFNANKGMAKMDMNPSEFISPEMGATLAQMLPAEMLAALGSPVSISMMKNGTVAGVSAVQPVFAGGQIINGNRLAKVGEDVSRLQLQLSENEVEKQTEQYYWQLVSLQEKMKTIEAVQTLLADIYKDVDVAVRAGLAMRNDLLQVQLRQNDVESQKLKLQNGIFIVKQLLGQYAGLTPSLTPRSAEGRLQGKNPSPRGEGNFEGEGSIYIFEVETPDLDQQNYSPPSRIPVSFIGQPERLTPVALALLPEYQLLNKQVEATKLQKKMEIGKNLPTVGVGAGYNYHNLLDNDRTFGMVFATVSIPISDWWGGSHTIKRKKIEHLKAVEEQQDKSELLKIRMQKAYNDVNEARQQINIAERSIEQAEENLRIQTNCYKAGTLTMSDLLQAQTQSQQAHDRFTEAYTNLQLKALEYRQATGQQ